LRIYLVRTTLIHQSTSSGGPGKHPVNSGSWRASIKV